MPITKIETAASRAWGLWKVEEEESALCSLVSGLENIPDNIRHADKRREFIAGRVLVRHLMESCGLVFHGITKDEFGKPLLKNSQHYVSLTHSFPFVAAIVDSVKPVGIDLEQVNPKLLRIGPRVLNVTELRDAGSNVTKHCAYWCCKETLMKIYGRRDVVFSENLSVEPFSLKKEDVVTGRIIMDGKETIVSLRYHLIEDFVLVFNV